MRYSIILAGGKGTRMKSKEDLSKVVFPILGKSILEYVLDTVDLLHVDRKIVTVGFGGEVTSKIVDDRADVVWQNNLNGTARAIKECTTLLKDKGGDTIIVFGDTPLLTIDTLNSLVKKHEKYQNDVTILSAFLEKPEGYARIIRDYKSQAILATKDDVNCDENEKNIAEVLTGVYVFNNTKLFDTLAKIHKKEDEEFSIPMIINRIIEEKGKVDSYITIDQEETFSVSDRTQLSYAAKVIRKRINKNLMQQGVSIEDPDRTYISPDVVVGIDTVISPNTYLMGKCHIGEGNFIGPNAYVQDSDIGSNTIVKSAYVYNSKVGNNVVIEDMVKISNYDIKDGKHIQSMTRIEK